MSRSLLQVKLSAGYGKQTVLQNIELNIDKGECVGLVGSSGAGKSTLLLALLGLLPWRSGWARGEVLIDGVNLLTLSEREARKLRGKVVALVPQSPMTALNSLLSLHTHFVEAWRAHVGAREGLRPRIGELFERVGLPRDDSFMKRKPNEISVGQAQRVTLALALLHKPQLVVADEPTSALDPVTQREVIALLREIREMDGTSLLYISHDLLSVLQLCDRVALLDHGKIAETLDVAAIERDAQHSTMRALLRTLPAPLDVLLRHTREGSRQVDRISSTPLPQMSQILRGTGSLVEDLVAQ